MKIIPYIKKKKKERKKKKKMVQMRVGRGEEAATTNKERSCLSSPRLPTEMNEKKVLSSFNITENLAPNPQTFSPFQN